MAGILFIISAPSGSGKSTVVNQLRSLVAGLEFSISWTTRSPRGSEIDSREYHFTTREHFEQMIRGGEFLEYAEVFGNYYGTAKATLQEAVSHGRDLLLDIDVQGAAQVRKIIPDAVSIFLMPPSPDVLAYRLRNRSRAEGSVQEVIIARRLARARQEIENYREYDYILVNDILDRAVEEMAAIVAAERRRRGESGNDGSGGSGDSDGPGSNSSGGSGGSGGADGSGGLGASGDLGNSPDRDRLVEIAEACRQENSEERIRPVLAAFGVTDGTAN